MPERNEPNDIERVDPDPSSDGTGGDGAPDEGVPGGSQEPPEILRSLPRNQREQIESFFGMTIGSMGNPIVNKLSEQHITDLISIASQDSKSEYGDRKESRRILAALGMLLLASVVGFASLLAVKENNDLLVEVLKLGAVGVGGLLGGYGFGRSRS